MHTKCYCSKVASCEAFTVSESRSEPEGGGAKMDRMAEERVKVAKWGFPWYTRVEDIRITDEKLRKGRCTWL